MKDKATFQNKVKVLNKLFDSGCDTEKKLQQLDMEAILKIPNITIPDMGVIMELQKNTKSGKLFAMVFMVVLSVSTFFIIRNHIDSAKQNEVYDNLAEIVEDEPPKENEGVTFSEDKDYLAEYLELYRQNEDMVGWIKVEDTNINYPVVQSVNEPNFYLKHKFDKTYSAYGCPYVQENCDVQKPSDNIIIYGHHMNDGSMFTGLMKYRNKSF